MSKQTQSTIKSPVNQYNIPNSLIPNFYSFLEQKHKNFPPHSPNSSQQSKEPGHQYPKMKLKILSLILQEEIYVCICQKLSILFWEGVCHGFRWYFLEMNVVGDGVGDLLRKLAGFCGSIRYGVYIFREQLNRILMKDKSKGSDYKCSQVFGYKGSNQKIHEEDIISVLKFNQDGSLLALGDKAGRIIMFKNNDSKKKDERYGYYTEFQVYNRQFDPLKSSDIDEEVLALKWMRPQGNYQKMLTMNGKFIKLWKIFEKPQKKIIRSANKQLTFPKFQSQPNTVNVTVQKTFPNNHEQDLIGMDLANNEEYIICSDIAKTLMYNVEKSKTPYLIADVQKNMRIQDLKDNINCIKMHPTCDSLFAYGTNRGAIVLSDTRISENGNSLTFQVETNKDKGNFFTQMISSYSNIDFMNGNKYIVGRDYLSVKVWDISKTDKPILSVTLQENIKSKLCEIFENDSIFDKFSVSVSKDSNTILTGNYNNCFHAIDMTDSSNTQYEISYKKQTVTRSMIAGKSGPLSKMDYARKTIASDFHPTSNILAVASLNCFFTYCM